jgi:hypothetical protein
MSTPKIEPIQEIKYTVKQSKYESAGRLPIRSIVAGPSGSGKGILLQNMVLDIYTDKHHKSLFDRIYIMSPSVFVDQAWKPVIAFIEKNICHHSDKEPLFFDSYQPDELLKIIDTQHKIIKYMKDAGKTNLFQILIIIDDFADDKQFSRNSPLLNMLFVRGRHQLISTIVSTQKINALAPLVRVNATELYIFRLRNVKDIDTLLEEFSALLTDKKIFLSIYQLATEQPYSFLYIKLTAKTINDMFFIKFDKKIIIND